MPDEHPLITELNKVQYDLTSLKARVSEVQRQVAALNLEQPDAAICETCGIKTRGPLTLAEHIYHSHNGPLPEHWAAAEAIADEPKKAA